MEASSCDVTVVDDNDDHETISRAAFTHFSIGAALAGVICTTTNPAQQEAPSLESSPEFQLSMSRRHLARRRWTWIMDGGGVLMYVFCAREVSRDVAQR
jgi:hypothetical protein